MRAEARTLLEKAVDSLIAALDRFNTSSDRGRATTALILLDHSFEMLLKASLVHRGGKIRDRGQVNTISFKHCLGRATSDGTVQFLSDDQMMLLRVINGHRDAAQHHIVQISEQQLYMDAQAGLTLFRDIMLEVFGTDVARALPARVLPLSTVAPLDLHALFASEASEIQKLLAPRSRRGPEAIARIRALAIADRALRGEEGQPEETTLRRIAEALRTGVAWTDVFMGAASARLTSDGAGPTFNLRLTREGTPFQRVPEGSPDAVAVVERRVGDLDFYVFTHKQLAERIGVTKGKVDALIWHEGMKDNADYSKEVIRGNWRYSNKAVKRGKELLAEKSLADIWGAYRRRNTAER